MLYLKRNNYWHMKKKLKILFVTTDLDPFCKAGGLGDVSRDLPRALGELGCEVRVVMPRHGVIDEIRHHLTPSGAKFTVSSGGEEIRFAVKEARLDERLPVFFIEKHKYFGSRSRLYGYEDENRRFLFFCRAVLAWLRAGDWTPDVIHCNDWHTGLIPQLLRTEYQDDPLLGGVRTLFTIHNLTFQMGRDWWNIPRRERDDGRTDLADWPDDARINSINFARRAILYADMVSTVSECYASEIMQKDFGQELHLLLTERFQEKRFFGIVNGIDYRAYNPKTDPGLAAPYNLKNFDDKYRNKTALQKELGLAVGEDIPLLGMVTRITEQKGFDLLMEIIQPLLRLRVQLVIVGDGDKLYTNFFRKAARQHPHKLYAYMHFRSADVTRIYAASDMFLMPSRFEPCGLGQMISLRYGSVPIVRQTGGLSDTIQNYDPRTGRGNGFTFKSYDAFAFFGAIVRAVETYRYRDNWRKIVINGMRESFSWKVPAQKYLALYRRILRNR